MARHSRNITANPVYSYAEKQKLEYGTKKQRVGSESLRRFDACALCLQRARDAVITSSGIIFCRECIYTDLLEQKKSIKRQKTLMEKLAREEEAEEEKARLEARERVLADFERSQLGLGLGSASAGVVGGKEDAKKEKRAIEMTGPSACEPRGTKRKLDLSPTHISRLQSAAEDAALEQIRAEQREARKAKLPSFWLSSLTPEAGSDKLKELANSKLETMCRVADPPHPLSIKQLISVKFRSADSPSTSKNSTPASSSASAARIGDEPTLVCASCSKTLTNAVIMFVHKDCGNVVCKTCVDTLVKPSKQCPVCDGPAKDKDLIQVKVEGTGFAAGGQAEVKQRSNMLSLN